MSDYWLFCWCTEWETRDHDLAEVQPDGAECEVVMSYGHFASSVKGLLVFDD